MVITAATTTVPAGLANQRTGRQYIASQLLGMGSLSVPVLHTSVMLTIVSQTIARMLKRGRFVSYTGGTPARCRRDGRYSGRKGQSAQYGTGQTTVTVECDKRFGVHNQALYLGQR